MIKQVTSLTNAAVSTIVTPSNQTRLLTIQNIGAGAVNLSFDGGTVTTNAYNGATGSDPTTTATGLGYVLAASGSLTLNFGGIGLIRPIRAILATATTTTLNICTDDNKAS